MIRLLVVALALSGCMPLGSSSGGDDVPDAAAGDTTCPADAQTGNTCSTAGARCFIEGTGVCNQPPAGGGCTCTDGAWECYSGCAEGCPAQSPSEGDACELAEGTTCRYWYPDAACSCTSGGYHCI